MSDHESVTPARFHLVWFQRNVAGLVAVLMLASWRHSMEPGALARMTSEMLVPVCGLLLALPVVVRLLNRSDPIEQAGWPDHPAWMTRAALASSIVLISLNVAIAILAEDVDQYLDAALAPIVLAGWCGINLGNWLHHRQR
jgi:cytochrome b561